MPDVAVVGGGPAGAAAAIVCARAGLEVVVFERSGTAKTGETLHPGVEPLLERLGVTPAVAAAGFLRHEGIDVRWGGRARFTRYGADGGGPWRGFQAWRASFDRILLDAAETAGAAIRRGVRLDDVRPRGDAVAIDTDRGSIEARWIIDASGRAHWLGRRIGLRLERLSTRLICGYGYVRRRAGARPRLRADAAGWTWTAEVRPGLYQWTRLVFDGSRPRGVPVRGEVVGRSAAADVTWRWFPRCAGSNYYLVGDAAAVFDPASSHGVLRALMTGMCAARSVVASARDRRLAGVASARYRDWLGTWVRHDATALRRFYRELPAPPAWCAAPFISFAPRRA